MFMPSVAVACGSGGGGPGGDGRHIIINMYLIDYTGTCT